MRLGVRKGNPSSAGFLFVGSRRRCARSSSVFAPFGVLRACPIRRTRALRAAERKITTGDGVPAQGEAEGGHPPFLNLFDLAQVKSNNER